MKLGIAMIIAYLPLAIYFIRKAIKDTRDDSYNIKGRER